jgi:hypothetical protein
MFGRSSKVLREANTMSWLSLTGSRTLLLMTSVLAPMELLRFTSSEMKRLSTRRLTYCKRSTCHVLCRQERDARLQPTNNSMRLTFISSVRFARKGMGM